MCTDSPILSLDDLLSLAEKLKPPKDIPNLIVMTDVVRQSLSERPSDIRSSAWCMGIPTEVYPTNAMAECAAERHKKRGLRVMLVTVGAAVAKPGESGV